MDKLDLLLEYLSKLAGVSHTDRYCAAIFEGDTVDKPDEGTPCSVCNPLSIHFDPTHYRNRAPLCANCDRHNTCQTVREGSRTCDK